MTFDPFGDFSTRGYLRNKAGLHDPTAVKQFEPATLFEHRFRDNTRCYWHSHN